jgi:hypothetical protein
MRKLLLPLSIVLLTLCVTAAPAPALSLPLPASPLLAPEEEPEEQETDLEADSETDEAEETEACEEDEWGEGEACEEEASEAEECILEEATAKVAANPGNGTIGLTIRYRASAPASVAIEARLRGGKGGVSLGASHTRFRRSGSFHDTFVLGEKRMERALAAREFAVELQAVNTPRYCRVELNGALRRAKRPLRAGASDRSDGRGQTRGKSRPARPR